MVRVAWRNGEGKDPFAGESHSAGCIRVGEGNIKACILTGRGRESEGLLMGLMDSRTCVSARVKGGGHDKRRANHSMKRTRDSGAQSG
jgi:hypothetical protein